MKDLSGVLFTALSNHCLVTNLSGFVKSLILFLRLEMFA